MEEQNGGPSGTHLPQFTLFLRFLFAVCRLQGTWISQCWLCLSGPVDAVLEVKLALWLLSFYQSWIFGLIEVFVVMETDSSANLWTI